MGKLVAFFAFLCTCISILLSGVCISAGRHPGHLEDYYIVSFNTSRIAVDIFNETAPTPNEVNSDQDGVSGWFHSLENKTENALHKWSNQVQEEIEDDLSDFLNSIAKTLGLHDWYSVHVMDFCEGFYTPYSNSTGKNITGCSGSKGVFAFNVTSVLQAELDRAGANITLSDLDWPDAINDAVSAVETAFKGLFIFYTLAMIFAFVALAGAFGKMFSQRRFWDLLTVLSAGLSVFWVVVASAMVNVAADKITNAVNEHGAAINVSAQKGNRFLSLTWAATALTILAGLGFIWDSHSRRQKEKKMPAHWYGQEAEMKNNA